MPDPFIFVFCFSVIVAGCADLLFTGHKLHEDLRSRWKYENEKIVPPSCKEKLFILTKLSYQNPYPISLSHTYNSIIHGNGK